MSWQKVFNANQKAKPWSACTSAWNDHTFAARIYLEEPFFFSLKLGLCFNMFGKFIVLMIVLQFCKRCVIKQFKIKKGTTHDRFSAIFARATFCFEFLFALKHTKALLKGFYPKRKEFAPNGSELFPPRIGQFSEGRQNDLSRIASLESVPVPLTFNCCIIHVHENVGKTNKNIMLWLTLTVLWGNSADGRLMIFFFLFFS